MLISVIIPTYNRKNVLLRSIDSVVNQTCERWELIIVDDGSTDGTGEGVEFYLSDNRVKYYYQTRRGVSVARNFGLEKAKGTHVIFLDSDDTVHPELLKTLYTFEIGDHDVICWEVLKVINGQGKIWKPRKMGSLYNNVEASFLAGSVCYKKSLITKVGGYDQNMSFGENYELGLRICQENNLDIKIIPEPLCTYNITLGSRSSNSYKNRIISGIHQYEKHKEKYDQHSREKSEMTYILGFLFEKLGRNGNALRYFKTSWKSYPLNYKAFLKIIYLSLFK